MQAPAQLVNQPKAQIYIENLDYHIFINNLPEDADPLELEQEFSRFGNVLSLDIHRDSQGRPLNYGYVQFERKEEVEKLVEQVQKQPFIFKGKVLKLEQFKAQTERKTESSAIYLRAFARPLNKDITEKQQKAIEYAWQLIITQHLKEAGNQVLDCFVKLDSQNKQPWAMVRLGSPEEAKINLDICEATRTHPSTQSSAEKALKLIKAAGPPADSIGQKQFEIKDVEPYFQELIKDPNDPFKGESENFFYNQVYSKHLNPDDRLILIQNINEDVTKEQDYEKSRKVMKIESKKKVVWYIGGSDSSGGAGLQAFLKTTTALGVNGMTVVTAVTAQNTQGVTDIFNVPWQNTERQLESLIRDPYCKPDAILTGLLSEDIIKNLGPWLKKNAKDISLVVDPVLVSKSGYHFFGDGESEVVNSFKKHLLPVSTLITPNFFEAQTLIGCKKSPKEMGEELLDFGCSAVYIKSSSDKVDSDDMLVTKQGVTLLQGKRIETNNVHGTGCTFAAAVTTYLASGYNVEKACREAKNNLTVALENTKNIKSQLENSHGPVVEGFENKLKAFFSAKEDLQNF